MSTLQAFFARRNVVVDASLVSLACLLWRATTELTLMRMARVRRCNLASVLKNGADYEPELGKQSRGPSRHKQSDKESDRNRSGGFGVQDTFSCLRCRRGIGPRSRTPPFVKDQGQPIAV